MDAIILTMAVRFLRRVNSYDYIEILREILERVLGASGTCLAPTEPKARHTRLCSQLQT